MVRKENLLPGDSRQPAASSAASPSGPAPATANGADRATVEQVAERETLVRLVGVIAGAMQRKTRILETMETFDDPDILKVQGEALEVLKDHFAWLQANLHMTSRCLESALLYVQVMYGDAYAGM